jgi:uncharacterized protein YkwD
VIDQHYIMSASLQPVQQPHQMKVACHQNQMASRAGAGAAITNHQRGFSRNISLCSSADSQLRYLLDLERAEQGLPLLQQSSSLDHLAHLQAQFMANSGSAESGFEDVEELCTVLNCLAAGENIQAGESPSELHRSTMETKSDLILSPTFTEYGMGVAQGKKDGKLYLCHLFRFV